MGRRSKKQVQPTPEEIFTADYMQALNEKFKLRRQLAGMMNQLEEARARNERLLYPGPPRETIPITAKPRPATRPSPPVPSSPTGPRVAIPPAGGLVPAIKRTQAPAPLGQVQTSPPTSGVAVRVQTVQPDPPPLFAEDPITGLPPTIAPPPPGYVMSPLESGTSVRSAATEPAPTPTPALAPVIYPETQNAINTAKIVRDYNDDDINISVDDDLDDVVVVVKQRNTTCSDTTEDLEDELARLQKRYQEITWYFVVFIFALFAIMFIKEARLMMVSDRTCSKGAAPPTHGDGGPVVEAEVELRLKLDSSAPEKYDPGTASSGECVKTPPTPPSSPTGSTTSTDTLNCKPHLNAAPPYDEQPIMPMRPACHGELQYDCDVCNQMLMNQTKSYAPTNDAVTA